MAAGGRADVLGLVGSTIEQVRFDACVDSGGFGLVYRGQHLGMDETVAIKCLRIASMQRTDPELREAIAGRFRDEMKLLYRLSAGTLDVVRCIGGGLLVAPATNEITPYMVLEWLEGRTLAIDLRERRDAPRGRDGRRSLPEAVEVLDSAVSGLAYAHSQGIVHRDIKPGNLHLSITREGTTRCKVLDFGLAKILSDEGLGVRPSVETGAGVHFCSPSYGAPEQFSPAIGPVGPWTDVYSLTLVLYEMILGDKVRPASSLADGLLKALDEATGSPAPKDLGLRFGAKIDALLARALARNPLERPRDAGVFWTALRELLREAPSSPDIHAQAGARPKGKDLGATIADGNVEAAMQRVRQIQAARASSAPAPVPAPAPHDSVGERSPMPFAGTMLMMNAPSGAPHMPAPAPSPTPEASPTFGGTLPVGNVSPYAIVKGGALAVKGGPAGAASSAAPAPAPARPSVRPGAPGTAPLAPPVGVATPGAVLSPAPAITMGPKIGPPSPMAASVTSSVSVQSHIAAAQASRAGPSPATTPSVPPAPMTSPPRARPPATSPRAGARVSEKSGGGLAVVIALLLIVTAVAAAGTMYWLRLRHH